MATIKKDEELSIVKTKDTPVVVDIANERIFSMKELLVLLSISKNTLIKVISTGDFPEHIVIAGQKRWTASMINECILMNNPSLRKRQALITKAQKSIESAEAV